MYSFQAETGMGRFMPLVVSIFSFLYFLPEFISLWSSDAVSEFSLKPLILVIIGGPIAMCVIFSTGIFYYRTSTVRFKPSAILVKKKDKKIIVSANDIASIHYVTSRYAGGNYAGAPIRVYYRIKFKSNISLNKVYFFDIVKKSPKPTFFDQSDRDSSFSKKIDRSKEFMDYIGVIPEAPPEKYWW